MNGEIIGSPISSSIILKSQLDCFMEKYQTGYPDLEIFECALDVYYSEDRLNFLGKNKNNINAVYTETVFVLLMSAIRRGGNINLSAQHYESIKSLSADDKVPFVRRTTNKENLQKRLAIFSSIFDFQW